MGGAALLYFLSHLHNVLWWEWLSVPVFFLMCNVFEWSVHRFVMHRPFNQPGLRAVYVRHTLNHHQFFSDSEMRFRDPDDWRVTVFPPFALVTFVVMSAPPAVILGLAVSANVGWLLITTTVGMYLIYEFMHYCCHVDENAFVRNCPFVNTLRRHHFAHHNTRLMMEVNMNLTFPIADWNVRHLGPRSRAAGSPVQRVQRKAPEEESARRPGAASGRRRRGAARGLRRAARAGRFTPAWR